MLDPAEAVALDGGGAAFEELVGVEAEKDELGRQMPDEGGEGGKGQDDGPDADEIVFEDEGGVSAAADDAAEDGHFIGCADAGDAKDEDEAVYRVIKMIKEHKVTTISGKEIEIVPASVCVHGDNEKALLFVKKIREALDNENIEVKPLFEMK